MLDLYPGYGYRRVRRELADRGVCCGFKSVAKSMRENAFVRRRPFQPRTSDGRGAPMPNLLRGAEPDGPGRVWVADITCIRLPGGFVYLACVLDAFLRRVVGRRLGTRPDGALALGALRQALAEHPPRPGWIHHSDRGSQYCSREYVREIALAGGRPSRSRTGCPYDNALMESFFKTLKAEEVWLEDYQTVQEADEGVGRFVGRYNATRKHSSLGYLSPDQYAAKHAADSQP